MRARFLAVLRLGGGASPAGRIEQVGTASKLDLVVHTDRLLLWSNGGMIAPGHAGEAIVGELFERDSARPLRSIADAGWAAIGRSRGQILVERYWGAYVAFAAEQDRVAVLRAPLGDVGCFYARTPDVLMMASDLVLLRDAIGRSPRVNAQALARHIAWPEWRRDETCLEGIMELRGGDRLLVSPDGGTCETLWSPWAFVARDRMIDDPDEAAGAIGQAVRLGVSARAASSNRQLLLLSGGLDSAIVAACLARAQADFCCLNLVGDDAASDEQSYAGLVARSVGAELHVQSFDLKRVDVGRSGAAHMPYPVHRCFTQAQDRVAAEVAERQGADMILDGGGGDNVFFASRTVSILADCLIAGGFDRRFRSATRTLGDLGQAGCLSLARKAVHRAWCRSPAPRQPPSDAFLSNAARAVVARTPPHPWFMPPPGVVPGRASHAALLVPAQNLVEAINAQAAPRALSPLVTQPVIEACLRVPSWHWLAPGRDRAAARRAFERELPAAIIDRRSKGTPTGFVATIFDRHRRAIREMLLGGRLAALGIVDTTTLERALDIAGPVRDLRFVRVMELVDAEAWARAQS